MKIYVWGTGVNAINFIVKCSDEIVAFIDNYKKEDYIEPWHVRVIQFDEYFKEKHKIVVATSEQVYHDIRIQLCEMGLSEFEDFFYHEVWRKKVAVVYGNCHILPIKEGLRSNFDFSSQYGLYPMRMIQEIAKEYKDDFNDTLFQHCDLFIHQSIRDNNRYGFQLSSRLLISRLIDSCNIISIPNLYGLPEYYFPQVEKNLPHKEVRGRYYFSFRDKFIEKMEQQERSIDYMKQAILYDEFVSEGELNEAYFSYIEKVKNREKEWDIKILDVLIDNHGTNKLYYDINHPTDFVLRYVTKRILERLNCDCTQGVLDLVTLLDTYEIPVYGQVCNYFGMNYDNNTLMRRFSKYTLSNGAITLDEYIQQYLWWMRV